ncbi:MAG: tRNA 2-thiouridine(34) synthase MnmA [Acidobacteria bacterium]|nr:tRNA 2-thiouridine(34) synthase MnmA [Acidobacteriota bacterium]
MKVLVAMSGGVDSSVAAALLVAGGHEVTGVTMRLWGGESDTGCCSVSDVDDARRAAQQLGVDHLVFNFSDDFDDRVVAPYVRGHADGLTPNPCIECNRHLKFARLVERARLLGFDAVATGHHARIEPDPRGSLRVARGADAAKDQSYVVHMLCGADLSYVLFPIGGMTKDAVRAEAARLGLRTASKPDSQDVCFIARDGGRARFLGERLPFTPARVVDEAGGEVGRVEALELVTVGQRRGIGLAGGAPKRVVLRVDRASATVVVGDERALDRPTTTVRGVAWPHDADAAAVGSGREVLVQSSAHGAVHPAVLEHGRDDEVTVRWREPQRAVAPGQTTVFYDPANRFVVGGGISCATS